MNDAELLAKVKTGLGITDASLDATIKIKMLAVKQYMINAGVAAEQVTTDLGIAALTVGVNDLWSLAPGEVKFSFAFDILMVQLKAVSMPDG